MGRMLPPRAYTNESCQATVRNERRGAFLLTVRGRYTQDIAEQVVIVMNELLIQRPLAMFADFSALESYDSASRMLMTEWCVKHRHDIAELHAFTRSGIVRMGVATAAMTMSLVGLRLVSHSSVMAFRSQYRSVLAA